MAKQNNLKFSLVVTCRNEIRSLDRWKTSILGQTRQPDEIIIVDSESDDGTTERLRAWAREDSRVRVIVEKCKPARGHNIGNAAATHEHIVSTDFGVRQTAEWFEAITLPFEADPSIEVVAGSVLYDVDTLTCAAARADFYISGHAHMRLEGQRAVTANNSMAFTKKVWRELGGLPEDLTFYADDSVFGRQILQAGYKVVCAPQALVYWARPAKLRQFWKECYNYGVGGGEAGIKKPWSVRMFEAGRLPRNLAWLLNGVRFCQLQITPAAIWRAIRALDIAALCVMPALVFGQGANYARGHMVGSERGKTACLSCRQRLRPEFRS